MEFIRDIAGLNKKLQESTLYRLEYILLEAKYSDIFRKILREEIPIPEGLNIKANIYHTTEWIHDFPDITDISDNMQELIQVVKNNNNKLLFMTSDDIKKEQNESLQRSIFKSLLPMNFDKYITLDITKLDQHQGPKIKIFTDTNCFTNGNESPEKQALNSLIECIKSTEYYELHQLPIVRKELLPGGIKNLELRKDELNGFEDFKDAYKHIHFKETREDLELFFNITYDYIKGLQEDIIHIGKNSEWRKLLKEKGHNSIDDITNKFYRKLKNNIEKNNKNNLFADTIIASCGLMYNILADSKHEGYSIVITGDSDIKLIQNMLLEEILPRYMAAITIKKIPQSRKYTSIRDRTKKLEDNAREHIKHFNNELQKYLIPIASVYNYKTGDISTFEMNPALVRFLGGDNPYLNAKTEYINLMAEEELNVKDAYEMLEKGFTYDRYTNK